jgi:hypothetical protein
VFVRGWLDENLKPLLPEGWRWVPEQRNLDTLDAVTVIWKQSRIMPLDAAPLGAVRVEGTLTVATPLTDIKRAEEALDDAVTELCSALDGLEGIVWESATKVALSETGPLAYDIEVWTTATPEPVEEPAPDPEPAPEPDITEE